MQAGVRKFDKKCPAASWERLRLGSSVIVCDVLLGRAFRFCCCSSCEGQSRKPGGACSLSTFRRCSYFPLSFTVLCAVLFAVCIIEVVRRFTEQLSVWLLCPSRCRRRKFVHVFSFIFKNASVLGRRVTKMTRLLGERNDIRKRKTVNTKERSIIIL